MGLRIFRLTLFILFYFIFFSSLQIGKLKGNCNWPISIDQNFILFFRSINRKTTFFLILSKGKNHILNTHNSYEIRGKSNSRPTMWEMRNALLNQMLSGLHNTVTSINLTIFFFINSYLNLPLTHYFINYYSRFYHGHRKNDFLYWSYTMPLS